MRRHRRQKTSHGHYCILVNPQAASFAQRRLELLIKAARRAGHQFSIVRPESAMELYQLGLKIAREKVVDPKAKGVESAPPKPIPVTALIAAGGDGTVNLVARAALESGLPLGILPMGRYNNISRSIHGQIRTEGAVAKIIAGEYKLIDVLKVADQVVLGSLGFGFIPHLAEELKNEGPPRFGMGWGKLGSRTAEKVTPVEAIIKADAFKFDIAPIMVNVNLLPYTLGMKLSPASIADDGRAELIFDEAASGHDFANYLKGLFKEQYQYGDAINLYRSEAISIQLARGVKLYLDGEILPVSSQGLTFRFAPNKIKLYG